jgi:hypothetical protein
MKKILFLNYVLIMWVIFSLAVVCAQHSLNRAYFKLGDEEFSLLVGKVISISNENVSIKKLLTGKFILPKLLRIQSFLNLKR